MDKSDFDVLVVGAGIGGATVAAHLSAERRVALIEAEEAAGYHTTGRSAALWTAFYGPSAVQALTRLSRQFFTDPPPGFTQAPLMSPRRVLTLARDGVEAASLDERMRAGEGMRRVSLESATEMVPAIRGGYAAAAAIEDDAFDMDVAALHQGFLRQLRRAGGVLALRSRTGRIDRHKGVWHVEVSGGARFAAPLLVNAAGAWGDEVAEQAGVRPLGLVPKRRTGLIIDPAPWSVRDWPMVGDFSHTWYVRPEARTKLMVSPADETPMDPHDVQPDELDVAIAIDRMQQALDIEVRRVERSWAGLRTFTPDGNLAFGWDPCVEGFLWCCGQGGYGIQTSPAAGRYVADLVTGRDPSEWLAGFWELVPAIDPGRFGRGS